MKRFFASLFLIFLVLAAVISLTKEVIVRNWIQNAFKWHLNVDIQIQEIYIDLLHPRLTFENLTMLNPPKFGQSPLANTSEIIVDYDLRAIFDRKFQIKQIDLVVQEINIVRDIKGEINLNSIENLPGEKTRFLDLSIENLNLTILRATYQDLSSETPAQVYDLNLQDLQFRNVETLEGLCRLVTLKVLERVGLSKIGIGAKDLAARPTSLNPLTKASSFLSEVVKSLKQALPKSTQ